MGSFSCLLKTIFYKIEGNSDIMMIGIDKIGLALPDYYLDLKDLAQARHIDPAKYKLGLMQDKMAIAPVTQDIVTLAAQAAESILTEQDKASISMIILGTESGIDQSKAAAIFVHKLLGIQPFARAIEIKEACYGATAGLEMARNHILAHPEAKVLVIASDIAKYGIASSGEATQGAGSIAMLVSAQPRLLTLNFDNVYQTRDVMDFWRPNYSPYPEVDGRFSTLQYIDCLTSTYQHYQQTNQLTLEDFAAMIFHIPFAKQGLKGLQKVVKGASPATQERLTQRFHEAIIYNREVGNIYTGSLFLSLLSLLENSQALKAGDHILFYSYGSGAVCELFSAQLVEGYETVLRADEHQHLLSERQALTVSDYEKLFFETIPLDDTGSSPDLPTDPSNFSLRKIKHHKRIYATTEPR